MLGLILNVCMIYGYCLPFKPGLKTTKKNPLHLIAYIPSSHTIPFWDKQCHTKILEKVRSSKKSVIIYQIRKIKEIQLNLSILTNYLLLPNLQNNSYIVFYLVYFWNSNPGDCRDKSMQGSLATIWRIFKILFETSAVDLLLSEKNSVAVTAKIS